MIKIITFHFAYNYGAALQAYALKTYINDIIGDCSIIDYRPKKIADNYHIKWYRMLKNPKLLFVKIRRMTQDALFEDFINTKLCNDSKGESIENIKNSNCILVTGSDQVWNTDLTHDDLNYFLRFAGTGCKRISYGASVGNSTVVENYSETIIGELKKFDYISCRESSAVSALKKKIDGINIYSVVDPTFLLSKEDWGKLCRRPKSSIPKKYILFYALTESIELMSKAEQVARESGLPIISIHPMSKRWKINGKNLNDIGPLEFLWLVNNADYVCTNSFHGSVFSVIFKKKCILAAHERLGERNKQLLEWMKLDQEDFGKEINFNSCDYKNLEHQIENSKKYLVEALR